MEDLTEEFILETGHFGRTEKDGVPSLFNGDNILLAIREERLGGEVYKYFDAFLHNEVDGSIFWAVTLRTRDQFRNLILAIEKVDIYEQNNE